MLRIQSEISIGDLFFDYVAEVKVVSDWRKLTDTCTLHFPRNLKTRDGLAIDRVIKTKQPVQVAFSYEGYGMPERFTGYVSQSPSAATVMVSIECEDEMWMLKQSSLTKSWRDASVQDVVEFLQQKLNAQWEADYLGDKISIGQFSFENLSAAKVLLKLKDEYGIFCFFRKGKLIVGKPYEPESSKRNEVVLEYGKNVLSWRELVYKRADEVRLKVKVTNLKPDGSRDEISVGDSDGEERTLHFYNRPKADLQAEAEAELERMRYDGFRGRLTLLGEPVCNHGDVVSISDERYPERSGKYFVDAVETTMTFKSIKQIVTIGSQA